MSAELPTETFVVDRLPRQVWDALDLPTDTGRMARVPALGGEVTLLERDPERLARFVRTDPPYEIHLRFEPVTAAGWPTRVVASASRAESSEAGAADLADCWRLFVANLQLWLAHEVGDTSREPPALGIAVEETGYGLLVKDVALTSPLAGAGLQQGDVLLSLRGIRVLTRDGLRGVLATATDTALEMTWARGNELFSTRIGPGS